MDYWTLTRTRTRPPRQTGRGTQGACRRARGGHDYQFQHQAIGDGYVFGVRDAVDEFAANRQLRLQHNGIVLPSFYFGSVQEYLQL